MLHMSMSKVLICGGMGYVGRHLAAYLAKKGFDVHCVSRSRCAIYPATLAWRVSPPSDLLNYAECEGLVQGFDYIFNLAADVGGIGHIQTHKAAGYASATINTNLLRAIVETKTKVQGYFLASSSCVYGEDPEVGFCQYEPPKEELATFATASEGYGEAKFYAEKTCAAFKQEHGVPVRIARYHSVYGPGESRRGKEHFLESLVNKVYRAKTSGIHEVTVWGDGRQRRSPLYIDDCVEGTARIMFAQHSEPVNLAHHEAISVNQALYILKRLSGIDFQQFHKEDAAVGVRNKTANLVRLQKTYSWTPETDLVYGLTRTWEARVLQGPNE